MSDFDIAMYSHGYQQKEYNEFRRYTIHAGDAR